MKIKILQFIYKVGQLVLSELPFILIFTFCLVPTTLKDTIFNSLERSESYKYYAITLLIAIIFSFIGHKVKSMKITFYILGLLLFATYMVLWLVFGQWISPRIMLLISETNKKEASECITTFLFNSKAIIAYLSTIIILIGIFLLEWLWSKKVRNKLIYNNISTTPPILCLGILTIIILSLGIYQMKFYLNIAQCKVLTDLDKLSQKNRNFPMDAITSTFYSYKSCRLAAKDIETAIKNAHSINKQNITDYFTKNNKDSINIIYILGESYIKHHASIYGYYLPTTPFMKSEKDKGQLIAFTDVVAPFNLTTFVQKNTFCCNSIADGEKWYETAFFPILFKKTGYNVTFWDNQAEYLKAEFFTFSVNSFFYNKEIRKLSYSALSEKTLNYDGQLVDDFIQKQGEKAKRKNLIIFHLIGQHFDVSERYPHTKVYNKFSAKDIKRKDIYLTKNKKQEIAEYDNATYYNDCVIKKIATYYANKPTIMIYFSDHGEEIYDYRDSKSRIKCNGDVKNYLKYQYEIPFVIWFSKSYMKRYPEIVKAVKAAKDKPFMTDNVCQILFHIVGMRSKWYKADRDLLSKKYKPRKRILNGYDYDKYCK